MAGLLYGVWLGSDLVNGLVGLVLASQILGLLGLYKVRTIRILQNTHAQKSQPR